jgi:hypothetical protein
MPQPSQLVRTQTPQPAQSPVFPKYTPTGAANTFTKTPTQMYYSAPDWQAAACALICHGKHMDGMDLGDMHGLHPMYHDLHGGEGETAVKKEFVASTLSDALDAVHFNILISTFIE